MASSKILTWRERKKEQGSRGAGARENSENDTAIKETNILQMKLPYVLLKKQ